MAKLLLEAHRRKPLKGRGVILGRQTVFITPDQAQELVREVLGSVRPGAVIEKDIYTWRGKRDGFISDVSLFSLFTDATIEVLDYSAYQGATILQDLCAPLPNHLKNSFDFVFNGSVLDNVFDPATAMDNIGEMLTERGISIHVEGSHHNNYTYIKFGPSWFYDYAVVNNYHDCKAFYCIYQDMMYGSWEVYLWTPFTKKDGKIVIVMPFAHEHDACIFITMEKQPGSTIGKRPIQANYRTENQAYLDFFNLSVKEINNLGLHKVDSAPGYYYIGTY